MDVRDGVPPHEVLPAAERIVAKTHVVEDRSLDVADGATSRPQPQVHLRFIVQPAGRESEDAEAGAVVRLLLAELDAFARCGGWELRRGPGRRWVPVASGTVVSEP
ncbi:hypothetical protein LL946_15370 [Knoellia locipacati]|uniref:hypothetical protein n=1 Tax=Knoellia locipacati TaxID=882824 RepID=UPI00385154B1